MSFSREEDRLRSLAVKLALAFAITTALAFIGLAAGRGAGHVPAIWWANAGLASVMLLSHRRTWPWLLGAGLAGNLTGHLLFGDGWREAVLLSCCDVGETAIAVFGVGRALGRRVDLTRQRQLLRFVFFAVLLGPLVASTAAGVVLHLMYGSPLTVPLRWFPASAVGMGVMVPMVLGLARPETHALFKLARLRNTLLYLAMIAAATVLIFSRSDFPWLFLIFPPLLFLVVRMGLGGGVLGCCVVGAIGTHFTVARSTGPLAHAGDASLEHRILILQLFVATAVLSVSVVAVVFADLKRATLAAASSEERFRELASKMELLAQEDGLTGVANRRQFDEVLAREWQRAQRNGRPLNLLLLDVDQFKAFNDLYGHMEGDRCLREVIRVAAGVAHRAADTVARYGGDEFAIILPEIPCADALELAERMRQAVLGEELEHAATPDGFVTISVGCAGVVPDAGGSAADLVAAADAALYAAKKGGRNRVASAAVAENRPV